MFGYVRVQSPELRVKEYEFYRGTYCGLCRSMGKCTGQCSRMTLSYDFAFLALLRLSFLREHMEFGQKRCMAHPLKKRNYMKRNESLDFCAGAAALLNYHKIKDDLADETGFKRLRARLVLPFMAHSRKKALKRGLGELDGTIARGLAELSALEASRVASVDQPAACFGSILGSIVSYGLEGSDARVASSLGVAVGKWIYIADALDDCPEDQKKGRYNPFLLLYDGRLPDSAEMEGIRAALKNELFSAEAAMDLMDFHSNEIRELLCNILYLGMPQRMEQIGHGEDGKGSRCRASKKAKKETSKDRS